jgi:hypothetical protein
MKQTDFARFLHENKYVEGTIPEVTKIVADVFRGLHDVFLTGSPVCLFGIATITPACCKTRMYTPLGKRTEKKWRGRLYIRTAKGFRKELAERLQYEEE